jgi:hypothetical protein
VPPRDIAELDALLIAAAEAPPERRIQYRDPIAQFGDAAVARLATPEWIGDPHYAAFSIRTIGRAAAFGATRASTELGRALDFVANDALRRDIEFELDRAGSKRAKNPKSTSGNRSSHTAAPMSVDDLEVDACYHRRDLHLAGLGGNWQRGISYPSSGTYCLLFSDSSTASIYGYRDAPNGSDGYRYYGEWNGPGDMTMSGGNQAVLDRSPELYLFTEAACGRVFRGRFECIDWTWERTVRDSKELRAIVFELRRVR